MEQSLFIYKCAGPSVVLLDHQSNELRYISQNFFACDSPRPQMFVRNLLLAALDSRFQLPAANVGVPFANKELLGK
jgi:hypothetical protein